MDQVPLVTSSSVVPLENFWTAISIYHDRPHLVNRKLAAFSQLLFCEISFTCPKIKRLHEIFTREALLYEIRKLPDVLKITKNVITSITEIHDKEAAIEETTWENFKNSPEGHFISLRTLLPRDSSDKNLEIVIFDKSKPLVTFFALQEHDTQLVAPRFPYHLELTQSGNFRIVLNSFEDADTSSAEWLCDKLFPKILKWSEEIFDEKIIKSLSLVAADEYWLLYSDLKSRYGPDLVKKWPQKTKTDPQKYVYEDIAIASYLICLWRKMGARDVNFVDCGCGNGLLVHILNQEGYRGCGFDLRRRQVWDLYSNETDLRVGTITPDSKFPEATWLIGNHSDELTPWIPVIALHSSPKTNFFVLPCCPYDFSGRKYVRCNNALSQYGDYLEYVKKISNLCGFLTTIDKLRIPSTRRTCLVGVRDGCGESRVVEITNFIAARSRLEFTPRNSVERVRNCTQLKKDLVERIVSFVVGELLQAQNIRSTADGNKWNGGGRLNLKDICSKITSDDKNSLKNECGGLQTLLKNHRYIFDVHDGAVGIRKPLSLQETDKYRDKPCWFVRNHPDGCFFNSEHCAYKH